MIGEVGERPIPVYVGRQSTLAGGAAQLVVAERFAGANRSGDAAGADLRREARRISTLANPHMARVREVALRGDDLVVFGDFIDGEKLREFWRLGEAAGERLPLEIALRVLLDVLTGAGALHGLRDATQQPMKLTHGELSPSTILVGADGVGRILHTVARRAPDARAEAASIPYLAPEVHSGDAHDARADIFSVGVLLWELLEDALLTKEGDEPAGVRVRSAPLPAPAAAQKAPWAKGLVPVVTRALAVAPEDRWPTAAGMAAEIRKAAGLKLAAASAASAFAKSRFGERVKQRRSRWEAASGPLSSSAAVTSVGPISGPPSGVGLFGASASQRAQSQPVASQAARQAEAVPASRSEEFSSSVLESFKPPPPPPSLLDSTPPSSSQHQPDTSEVDALPSLPPLREPEIAPASALLDANASGEVPHGAPVVFEEELAGPLASPFAHPSPVPAVATDAPPPQARNHRRTVVLGGAAALGIALASIVGVRVAHHEPPPAPEQAAAPPPFARTPSPTLAQATDPTSTSASATPPQASAAAQGPSRPAASHAKPASKPKAVAAPRTKPAPAHPQGHTK